MTPTDLARAMGLAGCCQDIVTAMAKALAQCGVKSRLHLEEAYVVAMAIMTESYSLAVRDSNKARPVLDAFHDAMVPLIQKNLILNEVPNISPASMDRCMTIFSDLVRTRYPEYHEVFCCEIWSKVADRNPGWMKASIVACRRLFAVPAGDDPDPGCVVAIALWIAAALPAAMEMCRG